MVDPEEMISGFNQFISNRLTERLKQMLSAKDPTLDWSKVRVISDYNTNRLSFEATDPAIEEQLQAVCDQLNNEFPL